MNQRNKDRNNFYSPYKRKNNYQSNRYYNIDNFIRLNESSALVNIHPSSNYDFGCPEIGQPVEIERKLEIEQNKDKKLEYEKTQGIKFLTLPENCNDFNFDLKTGLESFIPHIPHQNGIDSLLKWIINNKAKIALNNLVKPLNFDFVCWRGLLTTVSASAYEKSKDWMFSIILYKGTYYMCEIETDLQREQRVNPDELTKSFTYWGHKFETYITSDFPEDKAWESNQVPDPDNNFSTIIRNSIGNHKLMFGAEVDCCLLNEHKELADYCEIKTSRGESLSDLKFDRNQKFLKWWIQSYLVGIKLIKVGLRTEDGIVKKIIDCKVDDLLAPKRWWKENICMNLIVEVLDSIKKICIKEDQVYIASREIKSSSIRISKLEKNSPEFEKHYFLRDWYKNSL